MRGFLLSHLEIGYIGKHLRRVFIIAVLTGIVGTDVFAGNNGIKGSKHDLSITGQGPTKSPHEREICIFCHAPHGGTTDAPLWNRSASGATYETYKSSTVKAEVGQPTGASKLCLSCHDGTIALGMVRSRDKKIRFAGGITTLPEGRANLSTDLADDHPVSFLYDKALMNAAGGDLADPELLTGPVRLDTAGRLQCTTCHDAHSNQFGKFMVMDNSESALCVTCHEVEYWDASIHRVSSAKWNGKAGSPWPNSDKKDVKANGCQNCHSPHTAGTKQRLLTFPNEEDNCLSCHNGNVSSGNVASDFSKVSRHRIRATNGVHDPTEDVVSAKRHVECFDCHNGHAARNAPAVAPTASGALAGVTGINANGDVVSPIDKQYELCFRCHADSPDKAPSLIPRQESEPNVRLEFDTSNASFHPVVGVGKNPSVPSLLAAYDETSWIYCTACHSSNTGKQSGGSGVDGPHGSAYKPILERRMEFRDGFSENAASYALCYKCHNRASILGDESFPYHKKHIVDVEASCTTCHDPHGVRANTHLINFNRDYVKPNADGELKWEDLGDLTGNCYLKCHDEEHAPKGYP